MKKTLAFLLSLLLMLSFVCMATSCDMDFLGADDQQEDSDRDDEDDSDLNEDSGASLNGKTPEEVYVEALNTMNVSTNWEMTSVQEIDMVMTYNGQTQKQTQKQTIVSKMCGNDLYAKVSGASLDMETWYVDETFYVVQDGVKAKAQISVEKYREEYMGGSNNNLLNIPEEWFEGLRFEKDGDKYVLKFHVSGDQYAKLVGDAVNSIAPGTTIEIGEVDYSVVFDKKGDLQTILIDYSASFVVQGVAVEATYHTVSTVSMGSVDKIDPPASGDSFTDVTGRI